MVILPRPLSFQWDTGNADKNSLAHKVTNGECEEIFFCPSKVLLNDTFHSGREVRYIILGITKARRQLFIAFTIRTNQVRVISARDLSKKERQLYEKALKNSSL